MRVEFALDDLLRGFDNRFADFGVELAEAHVGFSRRALDDAEGADDGRGLLFPADLEVAERAFGLCAPVARSINGDFAKGIGLNAGLGHGLLTSFVGQFAGRADSTRAVVLSSWPDGWGQSD